MQAKDSDEADALLVDWLKTLDGMPTNEPSEPYVGDEGTKHTVLEPNLGWLHDGSVSEDLGAALASLVSAPVQVGEGGPMVLNEYGGTSFQNEKAYEEMDYADDAMRFLGLFRYWNAIEFFYPYKDILDDNWDDVLAEFIPRITEGDELAYKLTLSELTTRLHDSHVGITDDGGVLNLSLQRDIYAPLDYAIIEGQVVVTQITEEYADETPLQIGDVILAQDGKDIELRMEEIRKIVSFSREDVFDYFYLFATEQDSMRLTVLRDGQTLELEVPCYEGGWPEQEVKPSYELLEGNIGLINPGYFDWEDEEELPRVIAELTSTQGLIVDLRQYPTTDLYEPLAECIMPQPVTFANLTHPDAQVPGLFYRTEPSPYVCGRENPAYYQGKVVLLMNEESMSSAEFSIMALRQAPNATVIGSPSTGADGNVAVLSLPGKMRTSFTSKGVYTPDGGQTQRVGLQPDILCTPTIAGIAEGRDELMEKAIEFILN